MRRTSAKIGWDKRHGLIQEKPWIKRGLGMARGFHTSGAGSAQPSKFIMDYSGAIVKMNEDGTAVLLNAAADAGGGNNSAHAAMVAEELGLNYEDVMVEMGNTTCTLFDVPTHASRANYGSGLAVVQAAGVVKAKLFQWAADLLEAAEEDLVAEDGKIHVRGSEQRYISVCEVVQQAQQLGWGSACGEASVRPEACPPHFIVCFVEVAVDTATGKVEVLRAVTGADAGTPINLNTVEGQIVGGLHMGLGYGLMEDTLFEPETGRILNADFIDYKILTMPDMPLTDTVIADTYEPTGPFGAKGIGEGVTNPVAAAVANAIYAAVGVRVLDLPISAEKILAGIKKETDFAGYKERI